jgi:hypothetical protein
MSNIIPKNKSNISKSGKNQARQKEILHFQERLENAILNYQQALSDNNSVSIEKFYALICELYPPQKHIAEWYSKYYFLYDTAEDFNQEYEMIFCKVISKWKPRNERRVSRHEGSGEFKNYFMGALQNHYTNLVKASSAGKRNMGCKCPICNIWVSPLSNHLRQHHVELLWEQLLSFGYDINTLTACPFCKSHKVPRQILCDHQEEGACDVCKFKAENDALRKHMLSKHSTYLFQRFSELYPNHNTMKPKEVSVWVSDEDENGDENCYYDLTPEENKINILMNLNLTDIEQSILTMALSGNSVITYKSHLYKCSEEDFNIALNSLRDKMSLAGIEG